MATVFRSHSVHTEIAISAYNAMADECAVVSHMVARGQWHGATQAFVGLVQSVEVFEGICDDVFSPRGRAALCRPSKVGPRTVAGVLPMIFSVEWTATLMAAITDIRQCFACQRGSRSWCDSQSCSCIGKGGTRYKWYATHRPFRCYEPPTGGRCIMGATMWRAR